MKKRINLFSKKKQQDPIPTMAIAMRNYGLLFTSITIVLVIIAGGVYYFQLQKLQKLEQEKAQIQQFISADSQVQGNIVFFVNKKEQLRTFLKDDSNFEEYYNFLLKELSDSGSGARLISMDLDTAGVVSFTVRLTRFEDTQSLLRLFESQPFLSRFEFLRMQSFKVGPGDTAEFELQFGGKFIKDPLETDI